MSAIKNKPPSFFTGFYLSYEMDIILRGYALMHNIPVSQVLRSNIQKWISDEEITQETIIEGLVHKMKLDWNVLQFDKSEDIAPEDFKQNWSLGKLSNLPPDIIDKVIKSFTDETDKQDSPEHPDEKEG